MLIRKIKFTNYNDEEKQVEAHFNLSRKEVNDFFSKYPEGIDNLYKEMLITQNFDAIIDLFSELVDASYGVRSVDGDRFVKDPVELLRFKSSAAYEALMDDLMEHPEQLPEFMYAIIPQKLAKQAKVETERMIKEQEENEKKDSTVG